MMISKDERNWAIIAHLSSFLGYLGFGMAGIVGPLIVWLIKKDDSPFVADQAKEALNFQLSLLLAVIALVISMFLLIGFLVVWFVGPFLAVIGFVLPIIAAVKSNEGQTYRYPFTIRFIR